MSAAAGQASFRVGLIQMRSGRAPAANLDAAAKLIREAKQAGADYVLTPEMTNIMELYNAGGSSFSSALCVRQFPCP